MHDHDRFHGGDAGFTLVEVLVALMIFMVVSLGLLHSVLAAVDTSGDSRNRVVAANIAAGAIGQARFDSRAGLNGVVSSTWTTVVEGTTYTVEQSATWVPGTGGTSCGASAGTSLLYKRVGVAVLWPNMGATQPVRSDTVISPPAGVFDPTQGNLAVKVLDRDAAGTGFATVRLAGPTTITTTTDGTGCAFFAGVPAGSYNLQVTKLGHVDPAGAATATATVGAVAGQTVASQLTVDEAATLDVDGLADPRGTPVNAATYPLAAGTELGLGNLGLLQGRRMVPVQVGVDVAGVFPFAAGYRAWLGRCSDADPEGVASDTSAPWWPVPATVAPVTATLIEVTPGARTTFLAQGAQVEVRARNAAGAAIVGATVTARHPAQTGVGCNTLQVLTLGVTDSTGTVRATMPFGKAWTFRAGSTTLTTTDVTPYGVYPRVLP